MTQTNSTDLFSQWSEAQKGLFDQWNQLFKQATKSATGVPGFSPPSAMPIPGADFLEKWQGMFKQFSALSAAGGNGGEMADVLHRIFKANEAFVAINAFLASLAQQLPELFEARGDEVKSREVFENWTRLYYQAFEKLFGAPVSEPSQDNVDTWLNVVQANQQVSGLMINPWAQAFPEMQAEAERMFMKGDWHAAKNVQGIFRKTYEETLGRVFRMPGFGLTKVQNESVRKAYHAVQQFHMSLPSFFQYFHETGLVALKDVFDKVQSLEVEEVTPETVREFYKIWWISNENRFFDLFKSPDFVRTMNEVAAFGCKAKQGVDSLTAEYCKSIDIPSNREFDQMAKAVHELRRKVRLQQKEIDALKKKLSADK